MTVWRCDRWRVTGDEATSDEWRSDEVMESGNGGNGRNIGGRFGRDGMRFGLNGKGMGWNMVHDTPPHILIPSCISLSIHFTIQDTTSCRSSNQEMASPQHHPLITQHQPGGPGIDKLYLLCLPCRKLIIMVKMSPINSSWPWDSSTHHSRDPTILTLTPHYRVISDRQLERDFFFQRHKSIWQQLGYIYKGTLFP